jgi:hypothetical protein
MMAENAQATAPEVVYKPCTRAFFVYFVAMAICFFGPRINPAVGVPVWVGDLLGILVVAAVIYMKWGYEYRITPQGVLKKVRWPSPQVQEIAWADLDEVLVYRGLTQTLLRVGNLVLTAKAGGPQMFWFGLPNPKEIKEEIERRRA